MLYGFKNIVAPDQSQPQNSNAGNIAKNRAYTADVIGAVHALSAQAGVTVIELRAEVVGGKVALWLHDGHSQVGVGELDTLEVTGPPAAEAVELRVSDIRDASGAVAYKVWGRNEAGYAVGEWSRNHAGTGIQYVLPMPSTNVVPNWIKFTVGATPLLGQPTPIALDPTGVVKKEGAD